MSINWVMQTPDTDPPYTPLPGEQHLFTTPPRIQIDIKTHGHYLGKQQQPFSVSHPSGIVYLSNRRIIYIPDKPTNGFKNFAAQILSMHDSHISLPWFGANTWTALVQPTQGGGIPIPPSGVVELKLTFKTGGALDFHTNYEKVRERLQQAVEVSRIHGDGSGSSRSAMNGVDVSNVNLEDLPAYQEESDGLLIPPTAAAISQAASPVLQQQRDSGIGVDGNGGQQQPKPASAVPDEPPPGYEEAQVEGLQDELERRSRA